VAQPVVARRSIATGPRSGISSVGRPRPSTKYTGPRSGRPSSGDRAVAVPTNAAQPADGERACERRDGAVGGAHGRDRGGAMDSLRPTMDTSTLDRARLSALLAGELERFAADHPPSAALHARMSDSLGYR
jgi:hypothetical protein